MKRARDEAEIIKKMAEEDDGDVQLQRRRSINSSSSSSSSLVPENSDDPCGSSSSSANVSSTDLREVSSGGGEVGKTAAFVKAGETESKEKKVESITEVKIAKMPSGEELERFFSAAEKDLQKQFSKKYNFDVVKEEPLEGRYEWVRVNP